MGLKIACLYIIAYFKTVPYGLQDVGDIALITYYILGPSSPAAVT